MCLTPACDLVPGQVSARTANYSDRIPFMAVTLHPFADDMSPDVNSNLYFFLQLVDGKKAFGFNEQSKESSAPI